MMDITCQDTWATNWCQKGLKEGKCNKDGFKNNCQKTCQYCDDGNDGDNGNDGCKDIWKTKKCEKLKKKKKCKKDKVKQKCQKTCDACPATTPGKICNYETK